MSVYVNMSVGLNLHVSILLQLSVNGLVTRILCLDTTISYVTHDHQRGAQLVVLVPLRHFRDCVSPSWGTGRTNPPPPASSCRYSSRRSRRICRSGGELAQVADHHVQTELAPHVVVELFLTVLPILLCSAGWAPWLLGHHSVSPETSASAYIMSRSAHD
jgi:hypothetical protein